MKILSISFLDFATVKPPTEQDMQAMSDLIDEMKAAGALISTGGRNPSMLDMKITRKNGVTSVTDGPFAESKELVGGFALMNVKDREEAIYWTNRFLDLAGDATCTCVLQEVDMVE